MRTSCKSRNENTSSGIDVRIVIVLNFGAKVQSILKNAKDNPIKALPTPYGGGKGLDWIAISQKDFLPCVSVDWTNLYAYVTVNKNFDVRNTSTKARDKFHYIF